MKDFFEVNLPHTAPAYLAGNELKDKFEAAVASIIDRTEKLNTALQLSCMEPNKFHKLAANLFTENPEHFDNLSAGNLAALCQLRDDGKPVTHREEWPNAMVLFDTAFTTVKEWESLRHIGIGGSDGAVVMCCNKHRSKRQLFHDKVGTPMAIPEKPKAVFERGHIVEPRIVDIFCDLTGAERIPETRMFASKEHPMCTANIDAIIRMPNGNMYIFECKSTKEENRLAWMNDKVPRDYLVQTHQYPAVLNDERILGTYISCMFVVDYDIEDTFVSCTFDGSRNITHFVERNIAQEESILEEEELFWEEHILSGIEPEVELPENDLALVNSIVGAANPVDEFVPLSNRALPDIEQWLELNEKRKVLDKQSEALKDEQTALKVKFATLLGTEVEGRVEINDTEYYEVRYAPTKDSQKMNTTTMKSIFPLAYKRYMDLEELRNETIKNEFPDAYDTCMKEVPGSRRFSIKKKVAKKKTK